MRHAPLESGPWLVPEVLMKGESCYARSPLVSSVLSLTVNNLTLESGPLLLGREA